MRCNPQAEEQIKAVNAVLAELGCDQKPTILVLNKIDKIADRGDLNVLLAQHPKAVAVSGATGEGIDRLTEAVVEALTADFVEAEVTAPAANGKVQAYLAAHAEVYRQEFKDGAGGDPLPAAALPGPARDGRRRRGAGVRGERGARARGRPHRRKAYASTRAGNRTDDWPDNGPRPAGPFQISLAQVLDLTLQDGHALGQPGDVVPLDFPRQGVKSLLKDADGLLHLGDPGRGAFGHLNPPRRRRSFPRLIGGCGFATGPPRGGKAGPKVGW